MHIALMQTVCVWTFTVQCISLHFIGFLSLAILLLLPMCLIRHFSTRVYSYMYCTVDVLVVAGAQTMQHYAYLQDHLGHDLKQAFFTRS